MTAADRDPSDWWNPVIWVLGVALPVAVVIWMFIALN